MNEGRRHQGIQDDEEDAGKERRPAGLQAVFGAADDEAQGKSQAGPEEHAGFGVAGAQKQRRPAQQGDDAADDQKERRHAAVAVIGSDFGIQYRLVGLPVADRQTERVADLLGPQEIGDVDGRAGLDPDAVHGEHPRGRDRKAGPGAQEKMAVERHSHNDGPAE